MTNWAVDMQRAVELRVRRGERGRASSTTLGRGDGWSVKDVICTSGPDDHPFEERHSYVSVAVVLAGTFQYRTGDTRAVMTPGSMLLGNAEQCFECGHDHGAGDRCVSFHYTPEYFERIASGAGARTTTFRVGRLPPVRELSAVVARAASATSGSRAHAWDEIALDVAATVLRATGDVTVTVPRGVESRVSRSIRDIERDLGAPLGIQDLADRAGVSPYHYLRTFRQATGVTPHQFILRTRLRDAATRLVTRDEKVIDVALHAGFEDLANFNRAFRAEFAMSPREWRRRLRP